MLHQLRLSLIWLVIFFLTACVSSAGLDDFDKVQAAKARVELGLSYLNEKNPSQAKANLDKAVSYAPDFYLPYAALAYYYQLQGEKDKAKSSYIKALDIKPDQGDVLNNYAVFLCSTGEFELAHRKFAEALESPAYNNQTDTYENIALCAFAQDNEQAFKQALEKLKHYSPERAANLSVKKIKLKK